MLIKGVGVKNLQDYIKENFPEKYNEWVDKLPPKSKKIFSGVIFLNEWFEMQDSVLEPSKIASQMFYDGDYDKFLYTTGQYNGYKNLNGVYKLFIKIASVEYVLKKASLVFKTYYSKGSINVEFADNIEISLYGFDKGEEKWFVNISGWIDSLYKLVYKNDKKFRIENSYIEIAENKVIGKIEVIDE